MQRRSASLYVGSHQKEYISVRVENPIIHNTHDEGRYTTYEVCLQTNSPSFALKHSIVERRYSDFVWLRRALARTTDVKPPSLPIGRIFGLFTSSFLEERQKVLTEFMRQVVQETLFLSNSSLHLFLQTSLKRSQMDSIIKDAKRRGSMDCISRAVSVYGAVRPSKPIRLSASITSLSDSGENRDGASPILLSRSAPNFNGRSSPRSFGNLRGISETEADGSCLSSSVDSSQPLRDNNNADKDEDWVVLEPETGVDDDMQDAIPCGNIDEKSYTQVTWQVGTPQRTNSPLPKPTWNEFCMSKFLSSNALCVNSAPGESLNTTRTLEFRARSLENMRDSRAKRRLRQTLKREGSVHRSTSDSNIVSTEVSRTKKTSSADIPKVASNWTEKQGNATEPPIDDKSLPATQLVNTSKEEEKIKEQDTPTAQCEKPKFDTQDTVAETLEEDSSEVVNFEPIKHSSPPIPIKKSFLNVRSHSEDYLRSSRKNPKSSDGCQKSCPVSLSSTPNCEQTITSSIDSGVGGSDDDRAYGNLSLLNTLKPQVKRSISRPELTVLQ